MIVKKSKKIARHARHNRVRAVVEGTSARPRLAVYRSNKHISAQITDDEKQITLVSASTFENAKRALEAGVTEVVFDRGGFLFHGRVKALAEAAREAGLKF